VTLSAELLKRLSASGSSAATALKGRAGELSRIAGKWTRFGYVLGGASVLSSAYTIASVLARRPGDQYEEMGARLASAEIKLAEAERWNSLAEELDRRVSWARTDLKLQVQSYNSEASGCGAEWIRPPDVDAVAQQMTAAVGAVGPAKYWEPAPATILPRAPRPLPEGRGRDPGDCSLPTYRAMLQQFLDVRSDRLTTGINYMQSCNRQANIEASLAVLRPTLERAEAHFAEHTRSAENTTVGLATTGGTLTVISFFVSPPAAIVLGLTCVYIDLKGIYASSPYTVGVSIGAARQFADAIGQKSVYVAQEVARLDGILVEQTSNLTTLGSRVRAMWDECAQSQGWPANLDIGPEREDDSLAHWHNAARTVGSPMPYKEILSWR
jgi:hypothetical protein